MLPVMLGSWTEAFNRQWYEQETGHRVSRVGAVQVCARHGWRRCSLDGFVEMQDAVFEAKHVGAFVKVEDVLARYMPQLQHNMAVVGAGRALLSVIFANHKWEIFEIALDWLYQEDLDRRSPVLGLRALGRSPSARAGPAGTQARRHARDVP